MPVLAAFGAGSFAMLQIYQVFYRSHLFIGEYQSQPHVNHIGDGDFALLYIANLVVFVFAFWAYRSAATNRHRLRGLLLLLILANAACCFAFFVMHRTGVLVEYSEFIRARKNR